MNLEEMKSNFRRSGLTWLVRADEDYIILELIVPPEVHAVPTNFWKFILRSAAIVFAFACASGIVIRTMGLRSGLVFVAGRRTDEVCDSQKKAGATS